MPRRVILWQPGPTNYAGIQFREDQAGFLVGALAALVATDMSDGPYVVAGVYGIDIPPVIKFRNGFEQGARYVGLLKMQVLQPGTPYAAKVALHTHE